MEGMPQTMRRRLAMGLTYGLLTCLLISLPMPIGAQFVPIEQAREQEQTAQDNDLVNALTDINAKGTSAKAQITALFADVASGKSTASSAERKAATITEKMKSQMTTILTAYTKKSPSGTSLRTAYDAAQQNINDARRQTDEGLDQAYIAKQEDPNKLTGKYLLYEKKAKEITAKGLKKADDRLAERGAKDTVKKDLQSIIDDTQQQLEIATTSFLSVNTTVLASAVQRVKKNVLDTFGTDMVARFKTAESRGTDKALDLSESEQADVVAAVKEAVSAVDRALQTTEQLTQQIASSQLPTTSNVPGVNPLLEAKFKAQKQIREIKESTLSRLDKQNQRYQARTDVSALAKEVMAREITNEKNRLEDLMTEYLDYFTSGDPTKKKYNQAKEDAQEEAEGCTSFLCTIGRVASGVARGAIQKSTGIDIGGAGQQAISGGIFQIDEPNPYARSRYQTGAVQYTTLPGGVSAAGNLQYNPGQCLVSAPTTKKFAFVERAQAQVSPNFDWGSLNPFGSGRELTNPVPEVSPLYGSGGVNVDRLFNGNVPNTTATTAPKKNNTNQFIQFGLDLFNVNSRQQNQQIQGQYACNSRPPIAYGSPFTGTPVGGMLGYGSNNVIPGFNSNNWQGQMQTMMTLGAQSQPCLSQTLPLFNGGLTVGEYNRMAEFLGQGCMPSMPATNQYYMSPVTNIMRNLCSAILISGNQQLAQECQKAWVQVDQQGRVLSGTGLNLGLGGANLTPDIRFFPSAATGQALEALKTTPFAKASISPTLIANASGTAKTASLAKATQLSGELKSALTTADDFANTANYSEACTYIKTAAAKMLELSKLVTTSQADDVLIQQRVSAYCDRIYT